jgi:hypothetical protein
LPPSVRKWHKKQLEEKQKTKPTTTKKHLSCLVLLFLGRPLLSQPASAFQALSFKSVLLFALVADS